MLRLLVSLMLTFVFAAQAPAQLFGWRAAQMREHALYEQRLAALEAGRNQQPAAQQGPQIHYHFWQGGGPTGGQQAPVIINTPAAAQPAAPQPVYIMTQPGVAPVISQPGVAPVISQPGVAPVIMQPGVAPVISQPGVAPVIVSPGVAPVISQPGIVPKTAPVAVAPAPVAPGIPFAVPAPATAVPGTGPTAPLPGITTPGVMPSISSRAVWHSTRYRPASR